MRVGYFIVAVACVLVLVLLAWQSWFDYVAIKRQHQVQVEESVWLTADQMALNIGVTSIALARVLDFQAPEQNAGSRLLVQDLLPGIVSVRQVDLNRVSPDESAPWRQTAHRLELSGERFGLDSDPVRNELFWTLASP